MSVTDHDAGLSNTGVLHGSFAQVTAELVTYNETNHPVVDPEKQRESVDFAYQLGQGDGSRPGVDEHSVDAVLPSQEFVANAVDVAMTHLGTDVEHKLAKSRAGERLAVPAPQAPLSTWKSVQDWVRRHGFTLLALVFFGVVEYIVGTEWTQRVFDLSDGTAHIMALAMPVIFAVAGFVLAHVVMTSWANRALAIMRVAGVLVFVLALSTVVCAGLVISEVVSGGTTGGGGVSGGVSGGSLTGADATTYGLVKFGVYVSLLLLVTLLILLMHLIDLWREKQAHVRAAAMEARTAPTREQIAEGNIDYLSSYLDVADALAEVKTNIVTSYVAGVKANLSPRIGDTWNYKELLTPPVDPAWVGELELEVARLRSLSVAPTTDSTA